MRMEYKGRLDRARESIGVSEAELKAMTYHELRERIDSIFGEFDPIRTLTSWYILASYKNQMEEDPLVLEWEGREITSLCLTEDGEYENALIQYPSEFLSDFVLCLLARDRIASQDQ